MESLCDSRVSSVWTSKADLSVASMDFNKLEWKACFSKKITPNHIYFTIDIFVISFTCFLSSNEIIHRRTSRRWLHLLNQRRCIIRRSLTRHNPLYRRIILRRLIRLIRIQSLLYQRLILQNLGQNIILGCRNRRN
jgi:hypothetical protein